MIKDFDNMIKEFQPVSCLDTPYNRLTGRQITDWKTDQVKLVGKRVGKDFLFVKIKNPDVDGESLWCLGIL